MLAVDVETTGLSPRDCSILSIGAIDTDEPTRRFYGECRAFDGAHVSAEALEVNGFTPEQVNDASKKSEDVLVTEFLEWSQHLSDRTLTGQNVSFDRDFLQAAALRAGLSWDLAHRTLDVHTLAYMHHVKAGKGVPLDPQHRRSNLDLDAILNYCGIPDEPMPHNAMNGAISHAEVAYRILYGKKLLPEFDQYELPWS